MTMPDDQTGVVADASDWRRLHEKLATAQAGARQLGECLDTACTEAEAKQAERDALAAKCERMRDALLLAKPIAADWGAQPRKWRTLEAAIAICEDAGDLEPPATGAGEES